MGWVEQLQFQLDGKTVAIDGKTARRSHDYSTGKSALHVVSAWANHVNFCLGQINVDNKSNEIPAVKELLEILNLKGAVVTADAMHCQKETVKKIIEKQADYVLQVKETRTVMVAPAPAALKLQWAGLRTIGLICRVRELSDDSEQTEVSYFISSLLPTVKIHSRHLRNHWSVKNTLHHCLDVTSAEDAS